jgi:hypothetical protein
MLSSCGCADTPNKYDLFPELAKSLFLWVQRLHCALVEKEVEQVFFLSREGQPLKRMFDLYQTRTATRIASHYLEVSRRSTLLPSLAPLAEESFEMLFRQYRQMSLLEFLSSLGLESHAVRLTRALGLADGAESLREDDFPTSQNFVSLKKLEQFSNLYESERLARRQAFIAYLTELSGGKLPANLTIIDVGWKGTIQDNLYALLCRDRDTRVRGITGYYVGLVAQGAVWARNDKHGLLFSAAGGRSPGFHVFNENRALFEVLLAADHGSIVSYDVDAAGCARPIRGEFEEEDMLLAKVFPVQSHLFAHFQGLVNEMAAGGQYSQMPFDKVVRAHARMVFSPTQREREWFSSVFHVENYGVFERSYFSAPSGQPGLFDRIGFLLWLIRRRGRGALGFWPWITLNERGGALWAAAYAAIRRRQR